MNHVEINNAEGQQMQKKDYITRYQPEREVLSSSGGEKIVFYVLNFHAVTGNHLLNKKHSLQI